MERQQRTRLATVLILALVFATGFVVGMAVDRTATATPAGDPGVAASPDGEDGRDRGERRERRGNMYERVGELTADQRARIDSIVGELRSGGRAIRKEWEAEYERRYAPRVDSLLAQTRSTIRDVMTQEQAQRYDSLFADEEKRREERRKERDSDGNRRN